MRRDAFSLSTTQPRLLEWRGPHDGYQRAVGEPVTDGLAGRQPQELPLGGPHRTARDVIDGSLTN
jgi:hypothetical protein